MGMTKAALDGEREMMRERGMVPSRDIAVRLNLHATTVNRWMDDGKVEGEYAAAWRRYINVESLIAHVGEHIAKRFELHTMLNGHNVQAV